MLSPTTFAMLQTRSQIEHSCQTTLCFCWSPLHWQPRCVNTGGLYKYMRGLHDVWARPYCEADTGNAGFVSNIWSLFFVFSLAAQVWILPERTANHKPPSRQACTLPAVWERLVWKPLITGARSTARPGIATVWKFVNRCPFVLTSHQVLAEQWAPRGPWAAPGTFLISPPSGEPLWSAGGLGGEKLDVGDGGHAGDNWSCRS